MNDRTRWQHLIDRLDRRRRDPSRDELERMSDAELIALIEREEGHCPDLDALSDDELYRLAYPDGEHCPDPDTLQAPIEQGESQERSGPW